MATRSLPILFTGETGTGKEVCARFLHAVSPGAAEPFMAVNCAAIPSDLLESEVFGHERGAFSGAHQRHLGYAERARGGISVPRRNRGDAAGAAIENVAGARREIVSPRGRRGVCSAEGPHRLRDQRKPRRAGAAVARFGRTCFTGSMPSRWSCRPFASARRIFRGCCLAISRSLRSRLTPSCAESVRWPKRSRCRTLGGATCANCAIASSGR